MKNNSTWDDLKLKQLEDLWKQGLPISKIGEILGVSRNSVAGKAHRMGLPKRTSPISSEKKKAHRVKKIMKLLTKSYP